MRSVRPIEPANSTSPTITSGSSAPFDDKGDASGRVARGVADLEFKTANRQFLPVLEPQGRFRRRLDLETEHLALHRRVVVERELVAVKTDGQGASEQRRQLRGAADMVEVAVGVEDHGRSETARAHPLRDPLTLVAGIDDHDLAGISIAQQHAIRLNRADRENVQIQLRSHERPMQRFSRVLNFEF